MPSINYSKTIIYKIVCKDLNITEGYVGHTTNFIKRKNKHKNNCLKHFYEKHNCKIYQFIRENGNWENWDMIEIEKYPCNDANEARARERYWYEILNSKLNSVKPLLTMDEQIEKKICRASSVQCECGRQTRKDHVHSHRRSKIHQKIMEEKQREELAKITICQS